MWITIVRHARAGDKRTWDGPDRLRPLDPLGQRHADDLASLLAPYAVRRVISSPTTRCVQTVTPLADAVHVPIELWDELGPDGHSSRIVTCFGHPAFDDSVLCTHGELMRPLLRTDDLRRLVRSTGLRRATLMTKGAAWRLHISDAGRATGLELIAPRA
ncbi:MAG: phosphoglycerate mutase family protein [Ilumatobacteraceae bacterium]